MNYLIQAFKSLEEIDDEVVTIKPKKKLKESLNESQDNYWVLSDGANPRNSLTYATIDNVDDFISKLQVADGKYYELLNYINGNPKKVWDSKNGKVVEDCKVKEDVKFELTPHFDSRQSFYGKAKVVVRDDGTQILYSYGTPVCRIKDGKATLLHKGYLGWSSSQTTLRHVKDFLKQNGFEAGSINDLRKNYEQSQADISEDYDDLEYSWDEITQETIDKVKELTGKDIDADTLHFDDSRTWSFYVEGPALGLSCQKFGAYRNYMGGGVRGPIQNNGRKEDNTIELGKFFAQQLAKIEDLINTGYEHEEVWDKPTGVLESKEESKEQPLNENTEVNLNDEEQVEEAKKEIESDEHTEEVEKIVDADAETVDKLKDSYVGECILICKKCRKPRYLAPEDVKKDEQTGKYNIEDACPHCGANEGYEMGGQVAAYDVKLENETEASDEPQEEPKEEPRNAKVSPVEDEEENDISKVEDFDNAKFDKLVTKYLKEVYENVESFETKDGSIEENKVELEGTIKYTNNKTKDTKFVFENIDKTKGKKIRLVGVNESLTNDKDAFTVIAHVTNNALVCESFSYNYKQTINEEETLIRGRTSLKEAKQKESK